MPDAWPSVFFWYPENDWKQRPSTSDSVHLQVSEWLLASLRTCRQSHATSNKFRWSWPMHHGEDPWEDSIHGNASTPRVRQNATVASVTCFATAQASPCLKNLKCFCLSQNVAQKGLSRSLCLSRWGYWYTTFWGRGHWFCSALVAYVEASARFFSQCFTMFYDVVHLMKWWICSYPFIFSLWCEVLI